MVINLEPFSSYITKHVSAYSPNAELYGVIWKRSVTSAYWKYAR
jgi:hypothetical protein